MKYTMRLVDRSTNPSPTAVVSITTNWTDFPRQWKDLLDQVYGAAAAGAIEPDGHNVMVYFDDTPHVEVGVQVAESFRSPIGRVVSSALPEGPAATTVHRGPYDGLGEAHAAVRRWCEVRGLHITGVRWEIYGDWVEDPAQLETEVWYQVVESVSRTCCEAPPVPASTEEADDG